jgi:hypothetical protein
MAIHCIGFHSLARRPILELKSAAYPSVLLAWREPIGAIERLTRDGKYPWSHRQPSQSSLSVHRDTGSILNRASFGFLKGIDPCEFTSSTNWVAGVSFAAGDATPRLNEDAVLMICRLKAFRIVVFELLGAAKAR